MDENQWLADRFEEHRARLRAVAYRILGSLSDADDAVQETWLRLNRAGADEVGNLGGWLTTVVARVCLNMLRSRGRRREQSLGLRLPDPVVSPDGALQPDEEALLAEGVGLALLVVLDTLSPAERVAFVLHDLFDLPFEEIAPLVGRSEAAARQLASRARRRVRGAEPPVPDPDLARQRAVVDAFFRAGPPVGATSRAWWRCSIPRSCSGPTSGPGVRPPPGSCGGPRPWPGRPSWPRSPAPTCTRCWSTAPPAWSSP